MGDKEILAELKKSYEYLQDIIDNADRGQLKSVKELKIVLIVSITAQEIMAKKYEEVYKKIKQENDIALYYEEDIKICPDIYGAYIDNNGVGLSEGNLDWQKWWEDDEFINNF